MIDGDERFTAQGITNFLRQHSNKGIIGKWFYLFKNVSRINPYTLTT